MMKLLNRNYPTPIRAIVALSALILVLVTTGRFNLAKELAARCWRHSDFKLAIRRGAWYVRRSWIALDVSPDDYFDPTEGMTTEHLMSLEKFVEARSRKSSDMVTVTDRAFIAARRLDNDDTQALRARNITNFTTACNTLLHQVAPTPIAPPLPKERVGDFPIENAKKTLADFIALFPHDQLNWFLISGTFLGLIRENGFLSHDYDIDLGIFEDEIDINSIKDALLLSDKFVLKKYDYHRSGLFKPEVIAKNPDIPYILKIIHETGIHIDLFVHYRDVQADPPSYWHGSSLHKWNNSPFELTTYSFYGQEVLGPKDADRYLTENYGDWRTPVTIFNCTTDTPNLALMPHPIAVVIFLARLVHARSSDQNAASSLEQELLHNGFLHKSSNGDLAFSAALFARTTKE